VRLAGQISGGPESPTTMVPERALPLHDQWMTLLTVAIDPSNRAMGSFAGLPDQWNANEAVYKTV
jgi:hypothetical protein